VTAQQETDLEQWVRTLHPSSPDLQDDPYPYYKRLRAQCPVAHSEAGPGFWVLSKYDDINYVLAHPELFSSRQITVDPATLTSLGPDIPTQIDPPEHQRYRKLMNPWFRPSVIEKMEPAMRASAVALIEPVVGRPDWDFLNDFAVPFPCQIFLDLMGLPASDLPTFLSWKDQILRATSAEELGAVFNTVKADLRDYFVQVYADQQARPQGGDTVIGSLVSAQVDGERPLDESEFVRTACLMWGAGLDTVTAQLSLAIDFLAGHPEQREDLVAHPDRIPRAIEELMRYDSLVAECRVARQDLRIQDMTIGEGDLLWLLYGSAGRDEDQFTEPEVVDFDRTPIKHLGFGGGVHRCAGMHLARSEMRIALEEIHRLVPSYRLDPAQPTLRHTGYTRGVDRLHLLLG
jgi:cytochrome P450